MAVLGALGVHSASAAPEFMEFSNNSGVNDPNFLADHLIRVGSGITRDGDAQFQGNLDNAQDDGGGEFDAPDTVLGFFDPLDSSNLLAGNDNSSPFGDGRADAVWGYFDNDTGTATFKVSGWPDDDFDGFGDGPEDPLLPFGPYDIGFQVDQLADSADWVTLNSGGTEGSGLFGTAPVQLSPLPPSVQDFDVTDSSFLENGGVDVFELNAADFGLTQQDLDDAAAGSSVYTIYAAIDNSGFDVPASGVDVVTSSTGDKYGSASYFTDLDLDEDGDTGADFSLSGNGILLTSGVGTPPTENTETGFTGNASRLGDLGLDAVLDAAGLGISQTTDATVLAFDFELAPDHNAVAFEYMFGTEEYPNFPGFNDLGAVFINGRNVTVFPDGSGLIASNESFSGQLFDNETGPGSLSIEYDGVSPKQSIIVPLAPGTHSIKIAVSDANDAFLDTGLFVSDLHGLLLGTTPDDPVLPPPDDDVTDGFDLTVPVGEGGIGLDPSTPIWIDPPVAVGYTITLESGPNFATAELPPDAFGDGMFDVSWWDGTQYLALGSYASGSLIDFLALEPSGITQFLIEGIETSAMLDPNDPTAFPVGMTFVAAGVANVKMTPIVVNVPTPGALGLMLVGLGALGAGARRRRS
jgi:hypothetical protein